MSCCVPIEFASLVLLTIDHFLLDRIRSLPKRASTTSLGSVADEDAPSSDVSVIFLLIAVLSVLSR